MNYRIISAAVCTVVSGGFSALASPGEGNHGGANDRASHAHDQTISAFAQGLGWAGSPGTGGPATITIERDAQGRVSDIRFSIPGIGRDVAKQTSTITGVDISTGGHNVAPGFVSNPETRFNAPTVGSALTLPPYGAKWAVAEYLQYSTFGAWQDPSTNSIGGIAGGEGTPVRNMPKVGSATFNGKALGVLETGHSLAFTNSLISGDAKIVANWGAGTAATNITNLKGPNLIAGNLSGSAPITGNRFTGPMSGSLQTFATVPPTSMSGSQQGQFNGPKAQEVVGTWSVTGATFPGTFVNAAGSFGGKR